MEIQEPKADVRDSRNSATNPAEASRQTIHRLEQEVRLWTAKAKKAEEDRQALWARVNEAQEEQQFRAGVIASVLVPTFFVVSAGAALICQKPGELWILGILILGGCWVGVVWACLHFVLRKRHN